MSLKENPTQHNILSLISENTTPEEFILLVKDLVTDEDRKMFGDKAEEFITQAIIYPAAFAPEPATFDSEAYAMVISFMAEGYDINDIDPDKVHRLLTISRDAGIIVVREDTRFYIPKDVFPTIKALLEKFD